MKLPLFLAALSATSLSAAIPLELEKPDGKPADLTKPIKVYVLAGQSNMVGMGNLKGARPQYPSIYLSADPAIIEGRMHAGTHRSKGACKWFWKSTPGLKKHGLYDDAAGKNAVIPTGTVKAGKTKLFLDVPAKGNYLVHVGYGDSSNATATLNGQEVYKKAAGADAVRNKIALEPGKRYPLEINYAKGGSAALWLEQIDLVGVGDLIKGSVTVDPDGFPLVYFGSRDGLFRIVSFDQASPVELWQLSADAVEPTLWNDDWDGTAAVIDDHLFVGGENSNLHIVRLNRGFDDAGNATVDPELVFHAPGWDDELLEVLLDENVSIETAITVVGDTLWFANSGGLVQAWDIGGLRSGVAPERVFRFWTGDDTDASVVVDDEGFVYVGVEIERAFTHGIELGQLIKLDPSRPDDPVVWSRDLKVRVPDGIWATPALHRDVLYVPTNEGNLHAIDRATGATRWQVKLQGPVWSSPVVVDDVLLQADCAGILHAWDVADTSRDPIELWTITLPWCIESTPAVWDGQIVVGHRRGEIWSIGEADG